MWARQRVVKRRESIRGRAFLDLYVNTSPGTSLSDCEFVVDDEESKGRGHGYRWPSA
jgi:hypothetical protein